MNGRMDFDDYLLDDKPYGLPPRRPIYHLGSLDLTTISSEAVTYLGLALATSCRTRTFPLFLMCIVRGVTLAYGIRHEMRV